MVRRPLRTLLVLAAAAVVLVVGGIVLYFTVIRDDPPKRLALSPESETTEAEGGGATPAGEWVVRTGDDTVVGYRVSETFAGVPAPQDAVGRTSEVRGSLTVQDESTVTAAEITAGLQSLASDEERRDNAIRTRGLETERFPEAVFRLTGPLELPFPAEQGQAVDVQVQGELTLHGVTRPVEVPVQARWDGGTIQVAGTIEIAFADYEIDPPNVGGFVSVEDEGEIELQVTFVPA